MGNPTYSVTKFKVEKPGYSRVINLFVSYLSNLVLLCFWRWEHLFYNNLGKTKKKKKVKKIRSAQSNKH